MAVRVPSFSRHLFLLWGLRVRLGLNRTAGRHPLLAVALFGLSALPSVPFFFLGVAMMRNPVVRDSPVWIVFILNLLCFVTFCVWCAWPLLSAGVDDHSEVSRYRAFPVSPLRLLVASTVASQAEPRALVFISPLIGAAWSLLVSRAPWTWAAGLALLLAFALLTAAWSRAATHLVLNVLRAPNSAQILGGGFVVFLLVCAFIPPVDVSWLGQRGGGVSALDLRVVANAGLALGRVPPGFLGNGLVELAMLQPGGAARAFLGLLAFAALGLGVAYVLLVSFYRGVGRGGAPKPVRGPQNPFGRTPTRARSLLVREALDLWNNPRARLLASVPFILGIFLKVLSGRALFGHFVGLRADAWLLGGLALYGAVVVGSTFSQNAFAYDGHGMGVFLSAPISLRDVLRAKNLTHAGAGLGVGIAAIFFYRVYFGHGSRWDIALALAGLLAVVPVLLTAGNFLSVAFPVKFHANLQRRDRLPLVASMLGIVGATIGCAPFAYALRRQASAQPGFHEASVVLTCAAFAWVVYAATFPFAVRALELRREAVFQGVTRD